MTCWKPQGAEIEDDVMGERLDTSQDPCLELRPELFPKERRSRKQVAFNREVGWMALVAGTDGGLSMGGAGPFCSSRL